MSYRIWKCFGFSASHQLSHLPPEHPCARLHGHNYVVEVELASDTLDPSGFVLDYRALDYFKAHLDAVYDHRHLNDVVGSSHGTTAEALAERLWSAALHLLAFPVAAVRVRETDKTCAEYRP